MAETENSVKAEYDRGLALFTSELPRHRSHSECGTSIEAAWAVLVINMPESVMRSIVLVAVAVSLSLSLAGCKRNESPASDGAPVVAANAPAPSLPEKSIFEPTITGKRGSTTAGAAFAVKHPEFETPIVLTCLHIARQSLGEEKAM